MRLPSSPNGKPASVFNVPDFQLLITPTAPPATVDRSLCRSEQFIDALVATHPLTVTVQFRLVCFDDPPTHNIRLLFVHRRRSAPKIFCLLLANRLYVINYVPLLLYLFFTRKSGAKLLSAPTVSSGGAVAPAPL
jgi:hypothetical protein